MILLLMLWPSLAAEPSPWQAVLWQARDAQRAHESALASTQGMLSSGRLDTLAELEEALTLLDRELKGLSAQASRSLESAQED